VQVSLEIDKNSESDDIDDSEEGDLMDDLDEADDKDRDADCLFVCYWLAKYPLFDPSLAKL